MMADRVLFIKKEIEDNMQKERRLMREKRKQLLKKLDQQSTITKTSKLNDPKALNNTPNTKSGVLPELGVMPLEMHDMSN